jgi:hypothetical protein
MQLESARAKFFLGMESFLSVGIQLSLSGPIENIGLYIAKALSKHFRSETFSFLKPRRFGVWIGLEFNHQQSGPMKIWPLNCNHIIIELLLKPPVIFEYHRHQSGP